MKLAKSKLADVVQYCIYEISTGKWTPGLKLPSIRDAEKQWGVNRLTVLGAYRELEKMGLVKSKDRSGYYVAEDEANEVLAANLNELYARLKYVINEQTDLDLVYVFRCLSAIAISESKSNPAYAFMECTYHQAEGHSNEIYQKLDVFVKPISLEGEQTDIPDSVKMLMTTGFHITEVTKLGEDLGIDVINIPIEIDPALSYKLPDGIQKLVVVELEDSMSSSICDDIKHIVGKMKVEKKLVHDIERDLSELLAESPDTLLLLSPRVWGRSTGSIRRNKRVKLIRFRISDSSWKAVASALKIPFNFNEAGS